MSVNEESNQTEKPVRHKMGRHYALILFNVVVLLVLSQQLHFRSAYEHHSMRDNVRNLKIAGLSLDKLVLGLRYQYTEEYQGLESRVKQLQDAVVRMHAEENHAHHSREMKEIHEDVEKVATNAVNSVNYIKGVHKAKVLADKNFNFMSRSLIEDFSVKDNAGEYVNLLTQLNEKIIKNALLQTDDAFRKAAAEIKKADRFLSGKKLADEVTSNSLTRDLHLRLNEVISYAEVKTFKTRELRNAVAVYTRIPQSQAYDRLYFNYEHLFTEEREELDRIIILFFIMLLASWIHVGYLIYEILKRNGKIAGQAADLEKGLEQQKKLNDMQRKFVSMVSHEFRTPLAIIDSGAQKLLRRAGDLQPEKVVEVAKKTRKHINKLIDLLDSTLHTQRMESGQLDLMTGPCDIKRVISDVCQLQYEIHTRNVIHLNISELPGKIVADEKLIGHVFTNLVSNAVKYSPEGTEVVITGLDFEDYIEVAVKDRGVGIPEEDMQNLFSCFFRASTSIGISGTGIGLHLVKNIVDKHGGEIEVESVVGEGSTFLVRLPKADARSFEMEEEVIEQVA